MTSPRASVLVLARLLLCLALVLAMGAGSAGRASCAMHGMGLVTTHDVRGTPGNARHAVHHHEQGSSHDEHAGGCCCGGDCSGVAQVARIPDAATVRVAVIVAEPVSVFEPGQRLVAPAEPDRLLPFANGPPEVAAV